MRRLLTLAIAAAAVTAAASACGEDAQPLIDSTPASRDPGALIGTWTATQPGGVQLRYDFRPDGTYTYRFVSRQKKRRGTSSFVIAARGDAQAGRGTLLLRPRSGTKTRRDPDDPAGDYTRPLERDRQRYEWVVRGEGDDARLTLTIGGGLAVTYRRP